VKTVPEHVSSPIFGNKKKFPFSSRNSGTRKMTNFCFKREIRDEKKKERNLDRRTDERKNDRQTDRDRYRERKRTRERERERERERGRERGRERERERDFSDFLESENIFSGTNFSSRNLGSKLNTSRSRSRKREREN
jgi:hypothetical protein